MDLETTLAQDLCARLCHDLVGPLGTVAGALDMLGEDPEAADLARDAAGEIRRRLKFWRAACGGGGSAVAVPELAGLLDGMLAGGRARLELRTLAEDEPIPSPVAQMLLMAALLAGEALPRGGTVALTQEAEGYTLRPEGRVVNWPAALLAVLEGQPAQGPRELPAGMLRRHADAAGWTMELAVREGVLRLRPAIRG
ncbi:histidine phosphotransferase family protein [Teichococcus oryzae]|nr:histidine phosphotransferase family protein [Pseudoroseomonas oryzae]